MAAPQQRAKESTPRERPAFDPKYGVSEAEWTVLCDAIFPGAKTAAAIGMALDYCRVRKLDIFKRPVHIVPVYSAAQGRQIESVWPGISELRTTAARTGQYAGISATVFGDDKTELFEQEFEDEKRNRQTRNIAVTFPEWCQCTVFRILSNQRCEFVGPRVYWLEIYATVGRFSKMPNDRWQRSPRGQLEKCAEAAALRRAFPEEIGSDYSSDEMEGQVIDHEATAAPARLVPPPAPAITHQPGEVVPMATGATKEAETIHVPLAGRARKEKPQEPVQTAPSAKADDTPEEREASPRQDGEPESGFRDDAVDVPLDVDKWLDDIMGRMRSAATTDLLNEIWLIDGLPRRGELPKPDFQEAEDCYNACLEKLGA